MSATGDKSGATLRFGLFELDTRTGELRKRGLRLKLGDQAYCILRALLNSPGELVTRDQLKEAVWPDRTFVEFDSAINKSVSQIRAVLGDSGPNPRFIETLSRRGYRFIAPVTGEPATEARGALSIAVLPFENLTGDPALTYVVDGITEALTTGLGGLSRVRVISRTSAKACVAAGKAMASIGRELHVSAAVEGSVMRFGHKIRVNARLVDIHSHRVLWQGRYDSELENLLGVCDQLAEAIATQVNGLPVQRRVSSTSVTPEAHLAYLKGRYFWNKRTEKDLYCSVSEFDRALAIDPDFALAHTGLADAYVILGIWGLEPPHSAFCKARRAAERALELDDTLAEAHTCLAEVLKDYDWDWSGAELGYRRAIALNQNYSTAHHYYAQLLVVLTRYEEAAEEIELARRVDPLSFSVNAFVPYIYLAARDYARAVAEGQRAVELEPYSPTAHWQLGRACLFSGNSSQAVAELETASSLGKGRSMWQAELSFARARAGDRAGSAAILNEMTALARSSYVSPYDLALSHAGLGEIDTALDYLEQAYRERVMRIMSLGDPELDGLRLEPRFASLVQRLRLPLADGRKLPRL